MLACRPMLCFAVAVMAGVVAARFHPGHGGVVAAGWLAAAGLAVLYAARPGVAPPPPDSIPAPYLPHILSRPGFFARRGLNRTILLFCLVCLLVGAWRQERWRAYHEAGIPVEKRWFDATLLALEPSREHGAEEGGWRVRALLLTADGRDAGSRAVRLAGPRAGEFRRGDILAARVRRGTARPPAYPGAFDARFWLERDGLVDSLDVAGSRIRPADPPYRVIRVDDVSLATRARRVLDAARFLAIGETLERGGGQGSMLAAMLYGYRKDMPADLRDAFRRVGIGHVLAISGLHVGLIVWLLWWLGGLTGWSLRVRSLACLALAIVYLGLSGGQVAAARATVMAVIHFAGLAGGRKSDMLNSLGAAAFLIVLNNPTAPLDVSFQLSFTAVVFIYLAVNRPPGRDGVFPARRAGVDGARPAARFRRALLSLTGLSVATWVGLFPIIAIVFNQVNLVGLPINVVVIPLMSFVLAGGLLLPWLGWIPGAAWVLTLPSRGLSALALFADRLPASSFPAHAPRPGWVAGFYLFVFLLLLRGMLPAGKFRGRWTAGAAGGLALVVAGMIAGMGDAPPPAAGRVSVMPGWGLGSVVAEAPDGGLAIIGDIRRGGLNEAGWLHFLRRGGKTAVVSLGGAAADDLSALDYHNRIDGFAAVAARDSKSPGAATGWIPVAGAPGVEYATIRDRRGRIVWLAARAGGASACVVPTMRPERFARLVTVRAPGHDAALVCLGLAGDSPRPPADAPLPGVVAVRGRYAGALPERWFERGNAGVMVVEGRGVRIFADGKWVGADGSAARAPGN